MNPVGRMHEVRRLRDMASNAQRLAQTQSPGDVRTRIERFAGELDSKADLLEATTAPTAPPPGR